ncbi:hypothetical protein GN244_ATG05302 [Phytophthora infestans]|uniref:Uncharacterized protein n=1 Tax=Phytophthora infestans TaxID=4787 RepID=A0A833WHS5_PHYIN|nr:hypothetical protein GN244_ATG05302 [Phytophthora infestans]
MPPSVSGEWGARKALRDSRLLKRGNLKTEAGLRLRERRNHRSLRAYLDKTLAMLAIARTWKKGEVMSQLYWLNQPF